MGFFGKIFFFFFGCGPFLKSLLNLLQYRFCFVCFLCFGCQACGIFPPLKVLEMGSGDSVLYKTSPRSLYSSSLQVPENRGRNAVYILKGNYWEMELIIDLSKDLKLTDFWLLNLDSFILCHSQQDSMTPCYYL